MKALTVLGMMTATGMASAGFTDFSNDATGGVSNGFVSVDALGIAFSDTMGAELQVDDFAHQSDGLGLLVGGDDSSRLRMDFASNVSLIGLDFGNDDGAFAGQTVWAWLIGFNGGVQVDMVGFASNSDDVLNEAISLVGNFDAAEFYFGDASGNELNLIEIVDNVRTTLVPAPGAIVVIGFGGVLAGRRRR